MPSVLEVVIHHPFKADKLVIVKIGEFEVAGFARMEKTQECVAVLDNWRWNTNFLEEIRMTRKYYLPLAVA